MIYFLALIPATALTVAGYVAIFLSLRSEGRLRAFGKYLGVWAFTLAGLLMLGAIFAAAHGHRGHRWLHGMDGYGLHGPPRCPWADARPGPSPGPPPAPSGMHPQPPDSVNPADTGPH